MREICEARGLRVDIEWTSEKRIYEAAWFDFVAGCRAILGSESGCNVFDDHGLIRRQIEEALRVDPGLSYEEAFERYIKPHEGQVIMNQISPKIFEAIALRTALVLFEGSYSDVIRPNEHFIPLKKDFHNVDQVLSLLADDAYLAQMTDRAYHDVILSDRFSYRCFIESFDRFVGSCVPRGNSVSLLTAVQAYKPDSSGSWRRLARFRGREGDVTSAPLGATGFGELSWAALTRTRWFSFWSTLPASLRLRLRRPVLWALRLLHVEK